MKLNKLLIAVGLFVLAGSAAAVPIEGSIGFTGSYTHDGTDLSDATSITPTSAEVTGVVTGDFAAEGIADGDAATYAAFIFDPVGPQANIWSVGSFSFDLDVMSNDFQNASLLALSGTGTIKSTTAGLDDTFGIWTFTANETGANFTWSSGTAVPAPGIALLMAIGLAGVSVASKVRKFT